MTHRLYSLALSFFVSGSAATPTLERLRKLIQKLNRVNVLVIGDLMWDEYIWGDCSRISPEAPVPVVLMTREERLPGGANNVLHNLLDLKVGAGIIGIVGADKNGREMVRELNGKNLGLVQVWESPDRPTIIKTRIIAQNQQLMRLDREVRLPFPEQLERKLLDVLRRELSRFDAVILSDYDKGTLTPGVISGVIELCKERNVYVAVDPQVSHFRRYKGADIMTPNEKEASEGIGVPIPEKESDVKSIGEKIKSELDLRHLLITRSHKGMALFEDDTPIYVPTVAREVFDVSGAGDAVVSVYTAAMAADATPLEATLLANIAGGIVVGKLGTATVSKDELLESLHPDHLVMK